jgi:hypothetical protein
MRLLWPEKEHINAASQRKFFRYQRHKFIRSALPLFGNTFDAYFSELLLSKGILGCRNLVWMLVKPRPAMLSSVFVEVLIRDPQLPQLRM